MIKQFIEKVQQQELSVNSIIVTQDNKTESYFFHEDSLTSIRSISKVLSCLGVYHAIKSGIFDLDTKVLHFFPDIRINENRQKLENLTIEDLLTLRIGHKKGLLFSKDVAQLPQGTDLLEYIFNFEIPNNPGEFFIYNNANTYILSSIVQRETRMNFSDWVKTKVFAPLNIEDYLWENSAQGICLGASGLWLKNKDLHKVAQLLLNNGMYNDVEIINPQWIKTMTSPHVYVAELPEYIGKQDRCINKVAYGYHIWLSGDGSKKYPKTHYFCDGTDGQFLIVSPNKKLAITILSSQKNMTPLYPVIADLV